MKKLILGSTSQRRREILSFFHYPFEVKSPLFEESEVHFEKDPQEYVATLSKKKNESLADHHKSEIVLTADTAVYLDGRIFEKPKSFEEAFLTLQYLSGKWHQVYTGVCVGIERQFFQDVERTDVQFHRLDEQQITKYLSHHQFFDKAAGYAIQKSGSIVIRKIQGCYYNVMGLPIGITQKLLKQASIDLWDYLK